MKIKAIMATLSLCGLYAMPLHAEETDTKMYGSIRLGVDNVNAGTEDDGANGRDLSSRVGVKSSTKLSNGMTASGRVEYGLRSDSVDASQMGAPTLRLLMVGLKGDFGSITYGSQSTLFQAYVRSPYFMDGNDTVVLASSRDDDLTNYVYKGKNYSVAASIQTEGQDGDSVDSVSLAGDVKAGPAKFQLAAIKDRRGDNTGMLLGARVWVELGDDVTVSAFRHQQDEDFDHYKGSTGNVRLYNASVNGSVKGVNDCSGEARSNTGLYAAYKFGSAKLHARYAIDSCETAGDITSTKIEYVNALAKNYKYWVSHEVLSSDDARTPSTGDDMSETQIGIRYDF